MTLITLDEAIKHMEEVAKEKEKDARFYSVTRPDKERKEYSIKTANEHRQLAEWLKDYKRLLDQEPCEDAISRQAAINAMVKLEQDDIDRYGCAIPEGFNSDPAIEALNGLLPVTPQHTDAEIQNIQELEQAEIQKAYELGKEDKIKVLDKIKAEIEKQEKWLMSAGYNAYNVDIAFSSIKLVLAEREGEE